MIFAEIQVPHALAHGRHHVRPHRHVTLQFFAAQIEVAVLQAGLFGVFLLTEHHQGQLSRRAEHFYVTDEHLNFSGWNFGVNKAFVPRHDVAINADTPFAADFLNLGKYGAIGIGHNLCDAVVIAQIDEQQPAVITHAVHPTGQANGLTNV